MIEISQINGLLGLLIIVGSIFGGGVAAFFIIKKQLLSVSQAALKVTTDELNIYKGKVDRLEADLATIQSNLKLLSQENLALTTERDYLKGLIIGAITSRKEIHKELMDEMKKSDNTRVFKDGVDISVEAVEKKR